eukprot:12310956-Alexandrium_andersonii.AAC.1
MSHMPASRTDANLVAGGHGGQQARTPESTGCSLSGFLDWLTLRSLSPGSRSGGGNGHSRGRGRGRQQVEKYGS